MTALCAVSKDGEKYGPLTGTPEAKEMHKVAMVRVAGEHSRATQMFINLKVTSCHRAMCLLLLFSCILAMCKAYVRHPRVPTSMYSSSHILVTLRPPSPACPQDNGHFNQFGLVPFARVKPGGMSVVEQLYKEYGETAAGKGTGKGPDQVRIIKEGNKYLKTEFPNLSYIISARILGKQDL